MGRGRWSPDCPWHGCRLDTVRECYELAPESELVCVCVREREREREREKERERERGE